MSVWDDHIIPCAEKGAGQEGEGLATPALMKTNVSAATFRSCYPKMKMSHFGPVEGFGFLIQVSLHGFPVGNSLIVTDSGKPLAGEGLPKVIFSKDWK